jgi:hypothetical protein
MKGKIVMGLYKREMIDLDDFKSFFLQGNFIFWAITTNKNDSIDIWNYLKKITNQFENKLMVYIDDIDKKWKTWDRIMKSIVLLIAQQEDIKIKTFCYELNNRDWYYIIWGIKPIPEDKLLLEDIRNQIIKQLDEMGEL